MHEAQSNVYKIINSQYSYPQTGTMRPKTNGRPFHHQAYIGNSLRFM